MTAHTFSGRTPMSGRVILALSSLIHFLVDLSCIYFMNAVVFPMSVTAQDFLTYVILYNFCAFALPAAVGFAADRLVHKVRSRNAVLLRLLVSSAGCLLVGSGYFLFRAPLAMVTMIGVGNGMFHVGAGMEVLFESKGHFASPGIFISTGAVGVYLGTVWGKQFVPLWNLFVAAMFASAAVLAFLGLYAAKKDDNHLTGAQEIIPAQQDDPLPANISSVHQDNPLPAGISPAHRFRMLSVSACVILFTVVFIRSYYGGLTTYSWKAGFLPGLIFTLYVAGGKFSGGILADRAGLRTAVLLSLGIAGITALFSFESPVCGCISIFFFNMTMPLTLSMLAEQIPGYSGFAFGVLMLALFLGTLPAMLFGIHWFGSPIGLCFLCAVSMAGLLIVLRTFSSQNAGRA